MQHTHDNFFNFKGSGEERHFSHANKQEYFLFCKDSGSIKLQLMPLDHVAVETSTSSSGC